MSLASGEATLSNILGPKAIPLPEVKNVVPLVVFFQSQQIITPSQAGFRQWANSKGLLKLTMSEWQAEWDHFQKRPVR